MTNRALVRLSAFAVLVASLPFPASVSAASLADRLQGFVLLQVQEQGQAWYVNPQDRKRYYLRDGEAAYSAMRTFGMGMSNADVAKLKAGDASLRSRFRGKIVLQVQSHGEAYYVCPRDNSVRYLKDGKAAYDVMRSCSLGVTNADLATIATGSLGATATIPPVTEVVQPASGMPQIAGCQIFPADNAWNQDVAKASKHPNSAAYIASISATKALHPDFGGNGEYGIPITIVGSAQPKAPLTFTAYGDESDKGPYPIPANARVENGGDAHVIVLDKDACKIYELYNAQKSGSTWSADSAAIFDLTSNRTRPEGWTSADAAGLPILPGLVRYDEVAAGEIRHAIRFTAPRTQNGWIAPASHQAGKNDANLPPMGLRVRLKADYDISRLDGQAKVIATAMKKYGMILADNGSSWFFQGDQDARWNDDELNGLKSIPGSAFEAVYTGEIKKDN